MMTENDRKNALDYARQEGHQAGLAEGERKGLAKGCQEGIAEGRQEALVAAAAGMKKMGMPVEAIMQVTGLSEAAIAAL